MMDIQYLGNQELLKLQKTAFLASNTIPIEMVLKCYDWATGKQTALERNKYICEIAENIFFVGATPETHEIKKVAIYLQVTNKVLIFAPSMVIYWLSG